MRAECYGAMLFYGQEAQAVIDELIDDHRLRARVSNLFSAQTARMMRSPTNNSSEQALRWSVVFRKVTNGFCSDGGKSCKWTHSFPQLVQNG